MFWTVYTIVAIFLLTCTFFLPGVLAREEGDAFLRKHAIQFWIAGTCISLVPVLNLVAILLVFAIIVINICLNIGASNWMNEPHKKEKSVD